MNLKVDSQPYLDFNKSKMLPERKIHLLLLLVFAIPLAVLLYTKHVSAGYPSDTDSPSCSIAINFSRSPIEITVQATDASGISSWTLEETGSSTLTHVPPDSSTTTSLTKKYESTATSNKTFEAKGADIYGNIGSCTKSIRSAWLKTSGGDVHSNQ